MTPQAADRQPRLTPGEQERIFRGQGGGVRGGDGTRLFEPATTTPAQAATLDRLAQLLPADPRFKVSTFRQERGGTRYAITSTAGHHGFVTITPDGLILEAGYR